MKISRWMKLAGSRTLVAGLAIGLALAAQVAWSQETIYRWQDDQGTTHYTAQPPTDRDYHEVDLAAGSLSFVEAPEYETAPREDEDNVDNDAPAQPPREARADPRTMNPAARADYCEQLGERLRWLVAGRADMLSDVYPEDQVRNVDSRGALIEQVAAEIDDNC